MGKNINRFITQKKKVALILNNGLIFCSNKVNNELRAQMKKAVARELTKTTAFYLALF